ncbi:glycosyltransferase family 2 protein [Flavobacterium suaedae]|nr:glycosyltransferase [Flavobacterium suaedae]
MTDIFKESDIEVLVATMNRDNLDFLFDMFPSINYTSLNLLVVNQTTEEKKIHSEYNNIRVINVFEKGLSKSRNKALRNAKGKLCIITDDDVIFKPDFQHKIVKAFNDNSNAVIISFRVEDENGKLYKEYPDYTKDNTSIFDRLNIMSVEMVLNRTVFDSFNIEFNENFGLGATFEMGEEAIFINEVYTKGGKVILEPETLLSHSSADTNKKIVVEDKYYIQGALFSALFRGNFLLWVYIKILFDIKQKKITIKQIPVLLKRAKAGRKKYLQLDENNG